MNTVAISPRVSTCRAPLPPSRVNSTWRSMNASASRTAASCAASMTRAISTGATAHSTETDFTGENDRSYPATADCLGRAYRRSASESSRALPGARPWSRANHSAATSLRARTSRSSGGRAPVVAPVAPIRWATSRLNSSTASLRYTLYASPSCSPVTGCAPAPNSSFICSAVTPPPTSRPSIPTSPDPTQCPGASPFAE